MVDFTPQIFDNWSAIFDLTDSALINSTSKKEIVQLAWRKALAEGIPREKWFRQQNKWLHRRTLKYKYKSQHSTKAPNRKLSK